MRSCSNTVFPVSCFMVQQHRPAMGNSIMERLTVLDYFIVVTYLLILIFIGYRASFSKKKRDDETLFLANKSLGWSSIGFNMWGTNVGPSMLLAFASIG